MSVSEFHVFRCTHAAHRPRRIQHAVTSIASLEVPEMTALPPDRGLDDVVRHLEAGGNRHFDPASDGRFTGPVLRHQLVPATGSPITGNPVTGNPGIKVENIDAVVHKGSNDSADRGGTLDACLRSGEQLTSPADGNAAPRTFNDIAADLQCLSSSSGSDFGR